MKHLRPLFLCFALTTVVAATGTWGCATATTLPEITREALAGRLQSTPAQTRMSFYYGDMYDDNEKTLLSEYPFEHTSHIVDLHGLPIHPRRQRGILPAGTEVVLERLEFPGGLRNVTRMVTTPRYNPWIYLRLPQGAPGLPAGSQVVLVLPLDLSHEAAFDKAINDVLDRQRGVGSWLSSRAPRVAMAIRNKEIVRGMGRDELVAAAGKPWHWFAAKGAAERSLVAWYPDQEALMAADAVVEVRPSRPLPDPVAAAQFRG